MSKFNIHLNNDDVVVRNIIVGTLSFLNDTIYWYNQVDSHISDRLKINVPFYYSVTGSERYLHDRFLKNIDFDPDNEKAESVYNTIPRGILSISGFGSVATSEITNKYVRTMFTKEEEDGTLNTYSAETMFIPMELEAECTILVDTVIDQFKASERIYKTFYKSKSFYIDVDYTKIHCNAIFPDSDKVDKLVEFGFSDNKEIKLSFTLSIKALIPVYKEGSEIFAGNRMENLRVRGFVPPIVYGSENLTRNDGNPLPSGTKDYDFDVRDIPNKEDTWPINPDTDLPPYTEDKLI